MLGDTLRQLRREQGLRQADLARDLGLSQATIANYEQGSRFPDEAVLNSLADRLGVSLDRLMGRSFMGSRPLPGDAAAEADSGSRGFSPSELDQAIEELVNGRFTALQSRFDALLDGGTSYPELCVHYIQALLYEIGRRWEAGSIDVYQEHAASNQIRSHLALMAAEVKAPSLGKRFLGFSVSGNLHELGIRMVSDILGQFGWDTRFLGTDLPLPSLLRAIREFQPHLIGISATLENQIPIVQQTIYFLRGELKAACPLIMVGGLAFAKQGLEAASLGADAAAADAFQALQVANALTAR